MAQKLYSYNRDCKPPLPFAVRDVLKQSCVPLPFDEIVARVEAMGIASYNTRDAVRTILSRLSRGGEVLKHAECPHAELSLAGFCDDCGKWVTR